MPEGKGQSLEGRVISLLLLALLAGAGIWLYKTNKAKARAEAQAKVAQAGATTAREKASTLETENAALILARKKVEEIAKAFDEAPRIFTTPETSEETKVLKPGETFTADKPIGLIDPDRLAEATGALQKYAKQKRLLAECGTARDTFQEEARLNHLDTLKWKGRFPLGVLIGVAGTGITWILVEKPWK